MKMPREKIKTIGKVERSGFDTITVKTDGKCIGIIKGRNSKKQSMTVFNNKTITWRDKAPTIALRISHTKKLISLLNKGIKELKKGEK